MLTSLIPKDPVRGSRGMLKWGKSAKEILEDLTYLRDELGAGELEILLLKARDGEVELFASWVSICEVYYQAQRRGSLGSAQAMVAAIKSWPIEIIPADEEESLVAGDLKAKYRISLADSYVLGTAKVHEAMVVTGDPGFKPLEEAGEVRVFWLPQDRLT
jgi:predicted nucleic acid-binding protein